MPSINFDLTDAGGGALGGVLITLWPERSTTTSSKLVLPAPVRATTDTTGAATVEFTPSADIEDVTYRLRVGASTWSGLVLGAADIDADDLLRDRPADGEGSGVSQGTLAERIAAEVERELNAEGVGALGDRLDQEIIDRREDVDQEGRTRQAADTALGLRIDAIPHQGSTEGGQTAAQVRAAIAAHAADADAHHHPPDITGLAQQSDLDEEAQARRDGDEAASNRLDAIEADDWVTARRLGEGVVHGPHIANETITADKIAPNSLGESVLDTEVVDKLNTGGLEDGAVTTDKLADGAVTEAKLANESVGPRKIQADAVRSGQIADNAITSAHIGRNQILTRHIPANQITKSLMDDASVGTEELVDASVTEAKLAKAVVDQLGGGTDQTARDAAKAAQGTADENRREIMAEETMRRAADNALGQRIDAAQVDTDTVIEISPPFRVGETAARNINIDLRHPLNAYSQANILSVSVQGAPPVLVAYNPNTLNQTLALEVSAQTFSNIATRLVAGNFIDVEVRLTQGRNGPVQFIRVVSVPVEAAAEAATFDLRAAASQQATPVAGDRFFFTDENQAGDPLRFVQYRTLLAQFQAAILAAVPAPRIAIPAATIGGSIGTGNVTLRNNQALTVAASGRTVIVMRNTRNLPPGAAYDNNTGVLTLGPGTWEMVADARFAATYDRNRIFPRLIIVSDPEGVDPAIDIAEADGYMRFDPGGMTHLSVSALLTVVDGGSSSDSVALTLRASYVVAGTASVVTVQAARLDVIKLA